MALFQRVCVVLSSAKIPEILKFSCPEIFLLCPGLHNRMSFSSSRRGQGMSIALQQDYKYYKSCSVVSIWNSCQIYQQTCSI